MGSTTLTQYIPDSEETINPHTVQCKRPGILFVHRISESPSNFKENENPHGKG